MILLHLLGATMTEEKRRITVPKPDIEIEYPDGVPKYDWGLIGLLAMILGLAAFWFGVLLFLVRTI